MAARKRASLPPILSSIGKEAVIAVNGRPPPALKVRAAPEPCCSIVNIADGTSPAMLPRMTLPHIKMLVAVSWVAITLVGAIAARVTGPLVLMIAAVGLLPPLAMLLWWNDPAQTMTEAIDEIRRQR